MYVPGVLCKTTDRLHGGKMLPEAVLAVVLEEIAKMNLMTEQLNRNAAPAPYIQDKHLKEYGPNAYMGKETGM